MTVLLHVDDGRLIPMQRLHIVILIVALARAAPSALSAVEPRLALLLPLTWEVRH